MKQAKASADDLRRVREFFKMVEEFAEYGSYTQDGQEDAECCIGDAGFADLVFQMWNKHGPGVGTSWRRVVNCCQMLIDNCCDPADDTLEFRPDIKKAMEAAGVS